VLGVAPSFTASGAAIPSTSLTPTVWLRADAINGVDGSANPTDGSSIPTWADANSTARNATQATADRQPTFYSNVVNGKPVVRFNIVPSGSPTADIDDFMAIGGGVPLANASGSKLTLFVVAKDNRSTSTPAGLSPELDSLVNTRSSSSAGNGWSFGQNTPTQSFYFHTGGGATQFDAVTDQFNILTLRRDGLNFEISDNGAAPTSGTASGFTASTLANTQIGTQGGIRYFKGDIAEIIAFDETKLTDAEQSQVLSYLSDKYAIAVAVPEPTGLAGVAALAGLLASRRRRR
jgi:hypothetical protein